MPKDITFLVKTFVDINCVFSKKFEKNNDGIL